MKQNAFFTQKTFDSLKKYEQILKKWQKSINLVSKNTLLEAWERHFMDSAQLYPHVERSASTLVDMGSGAGFPGLILAIIDADPDNRAHRAGMGDAVPLHVHLIESDTRKGLFMKEVARQLGLTNVTVHTCRLEDSLSLKADIITARALADVAQLMMWAQPFMQPHTACLFLKGARVDDELTTLGDTFFVTRYASQTAENGVILHIQQKGV